MSLCDPVNPVASPYDNRGQICLSVAQQQFQRAWVKRKHLEPQTGHIDTTVHRGEQLSINDCIYVKYKRAITSQEVSHTDMSRQPWRIEMEHN